jgi:mono/diheme cytochrome c family protein
MRVLEHVGLGLLCCLILSACGEEKRDPSQWPISRDELEKEAPHEDGAALTYRRYCIGCHGSDGRANGGTTGADFTASDSALSKPDAVLIASVRDGKLGKVATMPPHKPVLNDAQIAEVVQYVRKQFGKTDAQPSAR